jgi:hypothetical protein
VRSENLAYERAVTTPLRRLWRRDGLTVVRAVTSEK